jgi:PPM family protein phosphatase
MNEKYGFLLSSHVGKVRKNNEDFYGEKQLPGGHIFVVCDGMGGHSGGEIASQKAVECILEYCTKSRGENAVQMIHEAIKFANSQVYGFAVSYPEYKGMGTTCVVVYIMHGGKIFYGHVGDSRLYRFNSREGLKPITKDHSYVQYLVDIGEIQESEMESHPSKNQILRALGIDETVKPEVCQEPVTPSAGDSFLICTDGLNGMVSGEVISRILESKNTKDNLEETCSSLIQAALDAGGKDNVTVGLIRYDDAEAENTIELPSAQNKLLTGKSKKYILSAVVVLALLVSLLVIRKIRGKDREPVKTEINNQDKDGSPEQAGDTVEDSGQREKGQTGPDSDQNRGTVSSGPKSGPDKSKAEEEKDSVEESSGEKKEKKEEDDSGGG